MPCSEIPGIRDLSPDSAGDATSLSILLIKKSPASGESTGFASDNSFLLNQWIPGLLPNNKGNNRLGKNNGEIRIGGWPDELR